jgi:hypothetical protein
MVGGTAVLQRFTDHWPEVSLALFAVMAGQIGRLGQKLERGEKIGWRQVFIELSMFPAFGSLAGALGVELGWPIWMILAAGITAGWLGFFTFRLIATITLALLKLVASLKIRSDTIELPGPPEPPAA